MNTIPIILLGDGEVGKTSIIRQLQEKKFTQYYRTTITPIRRRKILTFNSRKLNLCIYDTPGMEIYSEINRIYLKNIKIVLLIYDITNQNSFENLNKWFRQVKEMNNMDIIFSIVANKCDLYEEQVINKKEGENYAKSINAQYFEVCSLDYESIENMFICISNEFLEKNEKINFEKIKDEIIFVSKKYSNGIYNGYLKNNKRNGKGKMTYDNGNKYDGYWVNDKKQGEGIMEYDNEDIYNGTWENDNFIKGKITYCNDEVYNGNVKNNEKNGYGEMIYYNGNEYKGNWKNNKRNGEGQLIYKKDNKKLKGNWIDDELNYGTIEYSDEEKYNGEIKNNKRNGKGKMVYKNIGIYDGYWENDKKQGQGQFIFNNSNEYNGNWENDKRNGRGKLKFDEGEYDGEWKNDMKNGEGMIIYKNDKVIKGNFINNKREGDFIISFTDNKNIIEIKFKNDKIIGEGIYKFYKEDKIIKGIFDENYNLIKGKLKEKNSEYEGEFNDEYNKEGNGILKFNNGIIYDGKFKNNQMDGKGFLCSNEEDYKIIKCNKRLFNNQIINEIFKLNINDFIFQGEFRNNIQKGNGIKYSNYNNNFFLNNIIHIGNFDNLIKKGEGKVYFSNESYFDAIWENDEKIDETKSAKFYLNKLKIINETNTTKIWEKKIQKNILFYYGNNKLKNITLTEKR